MPKLQLSRVKKQIGATTILSDIHLEVDDGEFIVLLGPSGCGKTTLLRMIAGLETVSSGEIRIDDQCVNELPPRLRDVAMVFQNYSLYMHKTVRENLEFGLKMHKVPKLQINRCVAEVAELLRIESLLHRKPGQLSGGEKQRVAIGRALARNPRLYLFDEPLSNLDAALRMELRTEIKRLHQHYRTTSIYVTHDQAEAMSMADRLVVMNQGTVMQIGDPQDIYQNPQNLFVARFLGNPGMNLLSAELELVDNSPLVRCGKAGVPLANLGNVLSGRIHCHPGDKLTLGIRPEALSLKNKNQNSFPLQARVLVIERLGAEIQLLMASEAGEFRLRQQEKTDLKPGDDTLVYVPAAEAHLFNESGQRIRSTNQ